MNYYHFNAEDFAADDDFRDWVNRPNRQSDIFWRQFLKEHPEKYYQIEEARILVTGIAIINNPAVNEAQVANLWDRIEDTLQSKTTNGFQLGRRLIWWASAASIAIVLGFLYLIGTPTVPGIKQIAAFHLSDDWKSNEHASPLRVLLPDGSRVFLEKNSRIRTSEPFDGPQREVYLEGEAYFEVQKNPSKPFIVHANGIITKVLGTSFTIRARESDPDVTVSVKTGKVSVYAEVPEENDDAESKGLVLLPNQKAVYRKGVAALSKTIVEAPVVQVPQADFSAFVFEDASAPRMFDALEKLYGIEVVYDEEIMKNCRLTIDLTDEDLFQKLEVICKVLDVTYKLIDAQVIIYSHGCADTL